MEIPAELKNELSMEIHDKLNSLIMADEKVLISIPGSFGEAFILTNQRAIIIRENDSAMGSRYDMHINPLSNITGATVMPSGLGGNMELSLTSVVTNPESVKVYFPAYDMEKFKKATEVINMISKEVTIDSPKTPSVIDSATNATCKKCGAEVEADSVYCSDCGTQLRAICKDCGRSCKPNSKYCENCGRALFESDSKCTTCGSRMLQQTTYCTECGTLQTKNCSSCGMKIIENWKFCATCGREIGSEYIDYRAKQRLQNIKQDILDSSQKEQAKPAPAPASDDASSYNELGKQLFNDGDTDAAVKAFEKAILMEPNNASYHCNLAIAFDDQDMDNEALAEYETALKLDPNDTTALLSLGYMYSENDKEAKAQEMWKRVLEVAPGSAEAEEVRGIFAHRDKL